MLLHGGTAAANTALLKLLPSGLLTVDLAVFCQPGRQAAPTESIITSLADGIVSIIAQQAHDRIGQSTAADPLEKEARINGSAASVPPENGDGAAHTAAATKIFPPLIRGGAYDPYVPTTDGLLIQYDFDALICHQQSEYQDIKIFHSAQFGNMLLLDDDPNMAESDDVYTDAIMGSGKHSFAAQTVLILGECTAGGQSNRERHAHVFVWPISCYIFASATFVPLQVAVTVAF